jgi:hypothetical protein
MVLVAGDRFSFHFESKIRIKLIRCANVCMSRGSVQDFEHIGQGAQVFEP